MREGFFLGVYNGSEWRSKRSLFKIYARIRREGGNQRPLFLWRVEWVGGRCRRKPSHRSLATYEST